MKTAAQSRSYGPQSELEAARDIVRQEATALVQVAEDLGADFLHAVDVIGACRGTVVVMGMGKAGLIGQKISAPFCSTGFVN